MESLKKLTKKELLHLIVDATSSSLIFESFKRCNEYHNTQRLEGREPCYTCKFIAKKLNLPVAEETKGG